MRRAYQAERRVEHEYARERGFDPDRLMQEADDLVDAWAAARRGEAAARALDEARREFEEDFVDDADVSSGEEEDEDVEIPEGEHHQDRECTSKGLVRDARCDGRIDPIVMDEIPPGRGCCVRGNCYDEKDGEGYLSSWAARRHVDPATNEHVPWMTQANVARRCP